EPAPRLVAREAAARRLEARDRVLGREDVPVRLRGAGRGLRSCVQTLGTPSTTFAIAAPSMYATAAAAAPTASISRPLRIQPCLVTKLRNAPTVKRVSSVSTTAMAKRLASRPGTRYAASGT